MNDLYRIDRISENPYSNIKWRQEQIDEIIKLYTIDLLSIKKISTNYFHVHENSIKKVLQKNNIHIRDKYESRYLDGRRIDIFSHIDTEEKAYWLGFIAADGCVFKNYLKITLQIGDIEHLRKFNKFLNSSLEISTDGKYCSYKIGCKQLVDDLKKHGVPEKKSLILKPPYFLTNPFLKKAWIRGYVDGDGGLSISKNNKRFSFYVTSTKEVLNWMTQELKINIKPFLEHRCINTYRIQASGRQQVYKIASTLYERSSVYLDRKYSIFKKMQFLLQQ